MIRLKNIFKTILCILLTTSVYSCQNDDSGFNNSSDWVTPGAYGEKYKDYGENPFLVVHSLSMQMAPLMLMYGDT